MAGIERLRDHNADTAIILGSGLNSLVVAIQRKIKSFPTLSFQKSRSLRSRDTK
jgi:hypothetical protein